MPKSLPVKTRKKLLNRVLKQNVPVAQACREFGVSRYTFYKWLKRYKKGKGLKNKQRRVKKFWRQTDEEVVEEVKKIAIEYPGWSKYKIQKALPIGSDGKPILGVHGVYNILKRLSLATPEKRQLQQHLIEKKRPRILNPEERLAMIERVLKGGANVAQVCRELNISRYTFYKWLKRYQKASPNQRLLALTDKVPQIERWWRQATPEQEELVLKVVVESPTLSKYKIAEKLIEITGRPLLGPHGVYNILRRWNLTLPEARIAYARRVAPVVKPVTWLDRLNLVWEEFIPTLAPAPPPAFSRRAKLFVKSLLASSFLTTVFSLALLFYLQLLSGQPASVKIGLVFATISLTLGSFFFAYSMKYYLTLAIVLSFSRQPLEEGGGYAVSLNGRLNNNNHKNGNGWLARIFGIGNGNGNGNRRNGPVPAGGLQPSLEHIELKRYPFVSIHLPFYNERKVAERILKACTSFDYPDYEIVVIDDSTDETTKIVEKFAKKHNKAYPYGPKIKVLHRPTRQGFKGGALTYALQHINAKTEFVVVFDADFIPYPDTLELFIKYFKANNQDSEEYQKSNIAVVGGYQWHVLNKSENWITRGVRCEYAGSYVVERPGREILGLLKQISGSVYMIRADLLKKIGWGTSITEDFQLTLKLYEQGYKVIYTPYVQAPAECASTLKRLIRQRMRWAEGHSNCIKKMFFRLLTSPKMSLMEKLEVIYLSPYYLQAFFFLVGTFSWLLAETVFRARLPFWTSLWGWSLVLTNFFSLPLVNGVGLFLEESEERDYLGLLSFVALSYIMVPFQAYASVKGFLEKEEGPWFRTPKTGKITDIFTRGKFYRWIAGILPGRGLDLATRMEANWEQMRANEQMAWLTNPYVALETANNRFEKPPVRRKAPQISFFDQSKQFAFLGVKVARRVAFSKATLACLLVVTMLLNYMAFFTVKTSEKSDKKEEVQAVQGGGTEIFRSEPVDTNLIENTERRGTIGNSAEGVVYAAESANEEAYRWQVELPRATYSFGLQESGGIKPVVKIENELRGGNFLQFEPEDSQYVKPKVEGNQIEWEIRPGIEAKYTALADRIKADYVMEKASRVERLAFRVEFSDEEDNPRIFEQNKDGSISLILDNYSQEVFRFLAPTVEDAEGKEGEARMNIQKTAQGTAMLTITLDQNFLVSATYPITLDPTILSTSGSSIATAYGSQRSLLRDSYGKLLAVYQAGVTPRAKWSNDNGASWSEECQLYSNTGVTTSGDNFSFQVTDSKLYGFFEGTTNKILIFYRWTIERDGSNNITGIGSSNNGYADAAMVTLDSSTYAYRPSLIVTNMGSNDHVAVAWDFGGKSGGTNRYGMRFMHCKLSNDCTNINYWCKAARNGTEGDAADYCGTVASDLTADGDTDVIFVNSTRNAMVHGALNQLDPTGSNDYSKALVIVGARDDTNDIGAAYTQWNSGSYLWGSWTENATSISADEWDEADGYNLTLAQDNNTDKLVVSYRDTGNTKLETKRSPATTSAPTGSWTDLTFPSGSAFDPSIGVDNTNGFYYNFYKNSSSYIAFRYTNGASFGDTLGDTGAAGTADSLNNIIRGSKFSLSATKMFTNISSKGILDDQADPPSYRAAIYTDDGGSPSKPNTLVVESASIAFGIVNGWYTGIFPISPTILQSGIYWIVMNGADSSTKNAQLLQTTGSTNQGISASQSFGAFPFNFPSGTNNDYSYKIYAQVGWSEEIVLDQANADNAYPSVTEDELWDGSDFTKRKMDLIYTQGSATYTVYYHTWHFQQRYSYGDNITGYGDQAVFMDEKEYNSQGADDTNYTSRSVAATTYVAFLFKLKNTNRATNPDLDPTWEGCFVQPISRDIYLSVYNRELGTWSNIASGNSSTQCSSEGDFIQLSPDPPVTGENKRYFADDWVYFRVYSYNWEASSYTFYSDWFDMTNIWVPEGTLLTLLVLALFLPRIVREIKLRKELAYEKAETREVNF